MSTDNSSCGNNECRNLGLFRCSRCKNVFYCSQKCQKISWKDHKPLCCESLEGSASTPERVTQKAIGTCHNEDCGKIGALICSQCKNAGYCSKECQKVDWASHKKSCKRNRVDTPGQAQKGRKAGDCEGTTSSDKFASSPRKRSRPESENFFPPMDDDGDFPGNPMHSFLHQMSGMFLGQTSSVVKEYQRAYPSEKEHLSKIEREESIYRSQVLGRRMDFNSFTNFDFNAPQHFAKRWGCCLLDKEHLLEFLSQPERKMGDVYERRNYPAYESNNFFQTMRNTSIFNQVYEFGHVYVGFGFVDLFQLLWGTYRGIENEAQKLTFYGFDMSRVVTLRSKLIYGAMKHFKEGEISSDSILQIWFSSCWDDETETSFKKIVHAAFNNPAMFDLDKKDETLLRKWQNVEISPCKAKNMFSQGLENSSFDDVWTMKFEEDRVAFCRYLFTGCIFAAEDKVVCGNPTMFTKYEGATKLGDEAFFKAIDLHAITYDRDVSIESSLYATITRTTREVFSKFRDLIHSGRIQCSFDTKFIDPKEMSFAKRVKDLSPYGIDWSNVPDYMPKKDFIRFAEACSVQQTVHQLHFLNWTKYVFGACHVDWADNPSECIHKYELFKSKMQPLKKIMGMSKEGAPLLQFFEGEVYVNHLNDINTCLSAMFKSRFEDYFLSDENGKPLNRLAESYCDGLVSTFFTQSPTMFRTAFSFNEKLNLQIT